MMKGQTTRQGSLAARHSFVVRIWREEGRAGWRGWVQHTRTGESATVQDLNGLLTFVEHRTGSLSSPGQKRLK